jgi:hypothetical protein
VAHSPSRSALTVRNLAQLAADLRQGGSFSVTRLTSIKALCREQEAATRFAIYLARKVLERIEQGRGRARFPDIRRAQLHKQMMVEALTEMERWLPHPDEARRERLLDLRHRMREEQNEYRPIPFGAVRLVDDWELLLFEKALCCLLEPHAADQWCYQMARDYAELDDSHYFSGLVPASATPVQDIVDFWADFLGLDTRELLAPAKPVKNPARARGTRARAGPRRKGRKTRFTHRQGQFLAFIHLYRKLHRQGPAELDMVQYFRVTPPSVHGMVVRLEELGLVTREPGVPRSVRVAIPEEEIPELDGLPGPPTGGMR